MNHEFSLIAKHISDITNEPFIIEKSYSISGGDINRAFCLQGRFKRYFVKLNNMELITMFIAEFLGLQALAQTKTVNVPNPILYGTTDKYAYLVLEYINFGRANKQSQALLGQQLAQLHQLPQPFFGWHCDNTIGSTTQNNTACDNWLVFWHQYRLGFQLKLALQDGYSHQLQILGERLIDIMPALFKHYNPTPSLLHGDLWAGNTAVNSQGKPFIFDPACYYGDRETDLAMTELFGGFNADFYHAYNDVWALDEGYSIRKNFYNLYHILNHLHLFGGGYLNQAKTIMQRLLSELKY